MWTTGRALFLKVFNRLLQTAWGETFFSQRFSYFTYCTGSLRLIKCVERALLFQALFFFLKSRIHNQLVTWQDSGHNPLSRSQGILVSRKVPLVFKLFVTCSHTKDQSRANLLDHMVVQAGKFLCSVYFVFGTPFN